MQEIPEDIRAFILGSIDSVGEVEALLLLAAAPDQSWTRPEMARRLYLDEAQAYSILEKLVSLELVVRERDDYRFSPQSKGLAELSEKLIAIYRQKLVPVTHLIHSKPDSLRQFSDAFKLKRET